MSTKKANKNKLKNTLEEMTSEHYESIYKSYLEHHQSCFKRCVELLKEREILSNSAQEVSQKVKYREESHLYQLIREYSRYIQVQKKDYYRAAFVDGYPKEATAQAEWEKMAKRSAQNVIDTFTTRAVGKIQPILEAAGNKYSLRAYSKFRTGAIHADITFEIDENNSFDVKTQIVFATRWDSGTSYVRYPLTFHRVIVNGEVVKTPSQKSVHKAFGAKRDPKELIRVHFEHDGSYFSASGRVTDGEVKVSYCRGDRTSYMKNKRAEVKAAELILKKAAS